MNLQFLPHKTAVWAGCRSRNPSHLFFKPVPGIAWSETHFKSHCTMGKAAGPWSFPTVWRLFKHKEASSAFPTSLPPWESTKERMDRRMGDFEKVLRLSIKVWPWYPSSYLYRIYRTYKKMLSCGKTSSLGAGLHSSPGANRQHQRRNRRYVIAINTHIVSGHYLPSTFKSNQKVSMPNNTSWHDVLGMIQKFHLSFTPMSCKIQLFHLVFIILYVNIYI